jgi:Kef-type K+ transport system membrane component KefB
MLGLILKSAVTLIGCLIIGDIAGVILLSVVDIMPWDRGSIALNYVVWFVFGIFAGLSALAMAGVWHTGDENWYERAGARRTGAAIIITDALVAVLLVFLFRALGWSGGSENYVPDNEALTITYFVAAIGAMVFFCWLLTPSKGKP